VRIRVRILLDLAPIILDSTRFAGHADLALTFAFTFQVWVVYGSRQRGTRLSSRLFGIEFLCDLRRRIQPARPYHRGRLSVSVGEPGHLPGPLLMLGLLYRNVRSSHGVSPFFKRMLVLCFADPPRLLVKEPYSLRCITRTQQIKGNIAVVVPTLHQERQRLTT